MLTFMDDVLRARLLNSAGMLDVAPARFYAFDDVEQNVLEQVHNVRSHLWIPQQITVR